MDHVLSAESDLTANAKCNDDFAAVVFKGVVKRGRSIRLHKFLSYHYSDNAAPHEIRAQTGWTLDRAIEQSFGRILAQQRSDVSAFWSRADVQIEGGTSRTQQVIRWNLFQLLTGIRAV